MPGLQRCACRTWWAVARCLSGSKHDHKHACPQFASHVLSAVCSPACSCSARVAVRVLPQAPELSVSGVQADLSPAGWHHQKTLSSTQALTPDALHASLPAAGAGHPAVSVPVSVSPPVNQLAAALAAAVVAAAQIDRLAAAAAAPAVWQRQLLWQPAGAAVVLCDAGVAQSQACSCCAKWKLIATASQPCRAQSSQIQWRCCIIQIKFIPP